MLPPTARITVAQRTELLQIVRTTDRFSSFDHFVASLRYNIKLPERKARCRCAACTYPLPIAIMTPPRRIQE